MTPMNKISSNPSSRSPSRGAIHHHHHHHQAHTSTPGLIHLSPAMLQQQQSASSPAKAASTTGKRSKASSQRAGNNSSGRTRSSKQSAGGDAETGDSAQEGDRDPFAVEQPAAAAGQQGKPQLQPLEAGVEGSPANNSSSNRRARRRRQQEASAQSSDSGMPSTVDAFGPLTHLHNVQTATTEQAQTLTPARPRHRRGRSHNPSQSDEQTNNTHTVNDVSQDDAGIPDHNSASLPLLSKSAPTTSFLAPRKRANNGNNNSNNKQQVQQSIHIRGSNSADEWDMPSLARGNDALTWQQQDLGRKGSVKSANNNNSNNSYSSNKYAKKPVPAINNRSNSEAVGQQDAPSGISAMASAAAAAKQASVQAASPGPLTWQQELLQRSGPPTPAASVFTALEDGHSGAHPARDEHHRSRSSPSKQRRQKHSLEAVSSGLESDTLARDMASLALEGSSSTKKNRSRRKEAQSPSVHGASPIAMASPSAAHHLHNTRASSSRQRQVLTASESDADNSYEEEGGNLSLEDEPAQRPSSSATATAARPMSVSASPTKATLYAGPKFHNSPSAGQLPTPRLAAFLNRSRDVASPA